MALQRDDSIRFLCDVPAATPVEQVLDAVVGLHNELQRMRRYVRCAPRAWVGAKAARHLHATDRRLATYAQKLARTREGRVQAVL